MSVDRLAPDSAAFPTVPHPEGSGDPRPDSTVALLSQLWSGDGISGTRLGRFEVLRELGRGGCGIVFLALDPALGCKVALKVPRLEVLLSSEGRRRLLNEARAAALLDHPNIVPIREVGEAGPLWYIASAYCEGPTLAQWLTARRQPVPLRDAAALVATLADAVQHMHRRGILHRDLKPGNILLSATGCPEALAGRLRLNEMIPRVTDFGLAKLLDGDDCNTVTGTVMGTRRYMAPEQAAGRTDIIGPAADVYALGAILYELLIGHTPFNGATPAETAHQLGAEKPRPPRWDRRDVPRDLEAICLKCLAKAPPQRYATAGALAEDLRRFLDGRPTMARPPTCWRRTASWCRRHGRAVAFLAVGGAFASLLTLALAWSRPSVAESNADPAPQPGKEQAEPQPPHAQYALVIGEAGNLWKEGNTAFLCEALNRGRTIPGLDDLRGFEFHYLWKQGRTLSALSGSDKPASVLAFSADGKRLVEVAEGGRLCLWDIPRRRPLDCAPLGAASTCTRGITPTATRLAELVRGDAEDRVVVWDLERRACLAQRPWPARSLHRLAVSPDGSSVVLQAGEGTSQVLLVWNWQQNEVRSLHLGSDAIVGPLSLSPRSGILAVARWRSRSACPEEVWVELWDPATGQATPHLTGPRRLIHALAWSPDEKTLAVGGIAGEAMLWDVPSMEVRAPLAGVPDDVCSLAFSPDGKTLAVGIGRSGKRKNACDVALYDAASAARRSESLSTNVGVSALCFSPDGTTLAAGCGDNLVRLWEPAGVRPFLSLPGHGKAEAWSVAFSADGTVLASAGDDGAVRLWDPVTGRAGPVLRGHGCLVSSVAFSPQERLLASAGFDRTIRIWDAVTGQERACLRGHTQDIRCLAFSRDGRLLASGAGTFDRVGGELKIWDVAGRTERWSPPGLLSKVRAVAFAPVGQTLCSAGEDGTVRVWDTDTGELRRILHHPAQVWSLAFAPDGQTLVTGEETGALRFWDVETGQESRTLRKHVHSIRAIAFSPDGRTFATGGGCRTVRLRQTATGEELLSFPNQPDQINSLAFSPDGTALAAALHDGTIRIWQAPRTGD
jgi:WD40 repeat protein